MSYPCLVVHPVIAKIAGGGSCANAASYFAIDNRASLGHICRVCWRKLPDSERALYQEASDP